MPKIKQKTVYQFSELSEDAKQKAIQEFYDINIDFDWWEFTLDDAKNVGIKIETFDVGRGRDITGELELDAEEICEKIMKDHGDTCDTYITAQAFLKELTPLKVKHRLLGTIDEPEYEDEANELVEQFKKDIFNCYWKMLRDDYEYRQSEEAIIETIEANEYEFEEDGSRA